MIVKKPFFSICIPTFNSEFLLRKLLDSILIQTYCNYEIIISDDSTNNEVYSFYKSLSDNRIVYFRHKSIISSTENWNFALKQAVGKYKILVHHDDYFYNHSVLEKIYNEDLKNGEMMIYFLNFLNEDKSHKFYYNKFSINHIFNNPEDLLYVNYFSSPSCLVLNNKVDLLYNEKLTWLVDVEFYIRLFRKYKKIKLIRNASMVIGIGAGGDRITNSITKFTILKEYYLLTQKKIFKSKFGAYFINLMKLKIMSIGYIKSKLDESHKK
jgi:glycosyltransferase involved in cell wall biosynthesis